MSQPQVTIIVVPRERFQFTQKSLESLYKNTQHPFHLIYIDNNSPEHIQRYLEQQSAEKGFERVRSPYYLSPNQARNAGLRRVKTPYVVFVDNDIVFAPGWLSALMTCSQETGAAVVGSLVCQYEPIHTIVHCVGGDYMEPSQYAMFARGENGPKGTLTNAGQWTIEEKTYFQDCPIAEVKDQLQRKTVGFIEFHAMLVRTDLFNRIGLLDEGFCCTKEYLDFCMTATRLGELIYLEPASIVTFLTHPPAPTMELSDLPYFMLRWSDEWERASLKHFQKKWNLADSKYFQKRYKKLGQRRHKELIKPLVAQFSFLSDPAKTWLEKRLVSIEKLFNRYLSGQHQKLLDSRDAPLVSDYPQPSFPEKITANKRQSAKRFSTNSESHIHAELDTLTWPRIDASASLSQ
ncbi:glycosyltransferase family 2 protein [Leptothoe sp. PORK10 BA2]|uniref:glycosyltransferase family 2 protein n=1 Tax=Leptothoe sp. PORK10 BA2 TaxID=3110254 RepID=UPI002B20A661|nr:glycosyltransferase [Leptothoe sp. PORK10 BA2]MEA5466826.1 glycosyltransferase [Leptothoe sp. PORK10 BA2]